MLQISLHKKLHTADGEMQLAVDCTIIKGEFISLYGSSGAGKTSILRMLAGFMKPEKGFIKMETVEWFNTEKRIDSSPQQRAIGFVFQDYALFPNMSVKENIAFALAKNEPKDIVEELLELTSLTNLTNRKIQTLSGGQQQRVALARAIAKKPQLLLLDEPLSAIDNAMRVQLQETLIRLHKRYNLTTILVSHDIEEIVKLSDRFIHLENGKIKSYNSPKDFLIGTGYSTALVGNVLSTVENNNNVTVLVHNSILTIPSIKDELINLKKGDLIEVVHDEKTTVIINKLN